MNRKRLQRIRTLRSQGRSFTEIGKSLGITRQRAHRIYWDWLAGEMLPDGGRTPGVESELRRLSHQLNGLFPTAKSKLLRKNRATLLSAIDEFGSDEEAGLRVAHILGISLSTLLRHYNGGSSEPRADRRAVQTRRGGAARP